ncbi:MAG TPA: hypothetical protein VM598_09345, partial [Bdellovibrionota bacterium]|nr:hypothetical protein [Bdellovibrionota bacterium]
RRASAFAYPSAVLSAQELLRGGDYLKLLDYELEVYTGPLKKPKAVPEHPEYTVDELRRYWWERGYALLGRAIEAAGRGMPENKKDFCDALVSKDNFYVEMLNGGVPENLNYNLAFRQESVFFQMSYSYCLYREIWEPRFLDELKALRNDFPNLVARLKELSPESYPDRTVAGMRTFDFGIWSTGTAKALAPFMWIELLNSSTNLERKRGAYVLKHFFCDDLTPVNVVVPDNHAGDGHSSDPSCYSCHYKLDPMSGFFRTIGNVGADYSAGPQIRFDDGVRVAVDEYLSNWRADPASGRKWEVGYVRSSQYPEHNVYGETMQDLFGIIRTAPEVKKCVVKRMHQYFVGESQAVDPGYLEHLSKGFIEGAASSSSKAFRETLYKLVTSNAFVASDPRRGECYDHEPGSNPANKPPCRVSYLLEKNCVGCHGKTTPSGRLDLSSWIPLADGSMSFPHLDASGSQLSRAETLKRIDERMTTSDPDRRMPYNRYIPSDDQVQIVSWIGSQLKKKVKK